MTLREIGLLILKRGDPIGNLYFVIGRYVWDSSDNKVKREYHDDIKFDP